MTCQNSGRNLEVWPSSAPCALYLYIFAPLLCHATPLLQERSVWSLALIGPCRGVISIFPLQSHHICNSLAAYTGYASDGRVMKDPHAYTRYGDIRCKGAWSDDGLTEYVNKVDGGRGAAHRT